ncbi:MAG: type II toxin-antitoxin system RelE/ParE family toxin [Campylobacterales bacterium]|nr:type II toxin-antitoxin system RelE/ParE family toxin [Campylobacterales bacterium]
MLRIVTTETFDKNVLKIFKKDKFLYKDLQELSAILKENPKSGTPLGNNTYKVRLKNSSSKKGKSGGYRVITYVLTENNLLGLLTIYSKTNQENIFQKEIDDLIKELERSIS